MANSKTFYLRVRKALPEDEPLAPAMATLFVLWQDLAFEQRGLRDDDGFDTMDKVASNTLSRRLYFMRGNSRTLRSAHSLFQTLLLQREFKRLMDDNPGLAVEFRAGFEVMKLHSKAIKEFRDSFGAHLEHDDFGIGVRFIPSNLNSTFEVHSEDVFRPHLATDVVLAAMSGQGFLEATTRFEAFRKAIHPLGQATEAMIKAMSVAVDLYMKRVPFLPAK